MVKSVGIVVPAYNPNVSQLSKYIHMIQDEIQPDNIIIEIDEPSQKTISRLDDLPARINPSSSRRGKGAAVTEGFQELDTDILAFVDADGSTPADELGRIIDSVRMEYSDIAIGSRRHPDSDVRSNQTIARKYMGDMFARLARSLLNAQLYDFQCGAKAISKDSWIKLRDELYEPGFAWDLELIAIAQTDNLLIDEIPIQWHDQPQSTVDPVQTSINMLWSLLIISHRIRLSKNSILYQKIAAIYAGSRKPLIKNSKDK